MTDKTEYQLKQLMKYNRDGSVMKQTVRLQTLISAFQHLQEQRGYSKRFDLAKFDKKDMDRLVHDWKEQGLQQRTMANRLAEFRWMVSKLGTSNRLPRDNKSFGLRRTSTIPKIDRAIELNRAKLSHLSERDQLVTELRRDFGLRTEEALKFSHEYATSKTDDTIHLKGSWTKGGREREIEITRDSQRELLERVQAFQDKNSERSMIPKDSKFVSYYRQYNENRAAVEIAGHGLRHQWAQERFEQVSGLKAPLASGPKYSELTADQQRRWENGARIVNKELGHGKDRQDITATYIGARS